jgi:uncharacterized repeat protein (TIGR03803 family)
MHSRLPFFIQRVTRALLPTALIFSCLVFSNLFFSNLAFGQAETILHDFVALPHGSIPEAPVIADSAGNLYGTTARGGLYGSGSVFKLAPSSSGKWTETILYNFTNTTDGAYPTGGLIFDAVGNLYGATTTGGAVCYPNNCYSTAGTVFELSPNSNGTWTETTLYSFGATGDGNDPTSSLVFDKSGNLYGTTYYGGPNISGTNNNGIVFELSPNSQGGWTESVLYSFTGEADGGNPLAGLAIDSAGNLYGTTQYGGDVNCENFGEGPFGCGTVFELIKNSNGTWSETVLHSFAVTDGAYPAANVIFDSHGNLLGTTPNGPGPNCGLGCGTVFEMTPATGGTWTFKTVYTFAGGTDGGQPVSDLVLDSAGNFYGTTKIGGDANNCQYGCGTVYELTPTTSFAWKEKIIHHFSGSATNPYGIDGEFPLAGVAFDQLGNLYGTASGGGATGTTCNQCSGTVFKLGKNTSGQWTTSLLFSFVASGDGLNPSYEPISAPASGSSGDLYGVTYYGGAYGDGAIYELSPQSYGGYSERVIYSFKGGTDGDAPAGGLVADSAGNFYGATQYGGVNSGCTYSGGCGTIYELSPASGGKWTEQVLHAFSSTDGAGINGALTMDSSGNLFGTTYGGNNGASTFFELSPSGSAWTFTVLHTFQSPDVFNASGQLLLDSSGNFYSVGQGGNKGAGVVYELSPSSSGYTVTVLHTFAGGADGTSPDSPLVEKNGVLYGTTYEGGGYTGYCLTYGCGTVFALAHSGSTWQKKTIYTFAGGTDASSPAYGPTLDSEGNLYGSAWAGGAPNNCDRGNGSGGCGAIYKLTESGGQWTESVINDFGLIPFDIYDPGPLLWTSSNLLIGTGGGGDDGGGAVFQINLNSARQLSFDPSKPQAPQWHKINPPASRAQSGKGGN